MLRISVLGFRILIALCTGSFACAQVIPPPEAPDVGPIVTLQPPRDELLNKIGLSYQLGLNISVDFRRLGGRSPAAIPLVGTAVNRNYDDGYNLIDFDHNNHGGYIGTWNWGNYSPNSIQNQELVLQNYASLGNLSSNDRTDDPHNGFELNYSRQLYKGNGWRAGVQAAFAYQRIEITDSRSFSTTAYRTNDFFPLNGVTLDNKAYTNDFVGPGPVIASQPGYYYPPTRTVDVLPGAASVTGHRELDANVFLFRFGPYFEVPITEKLSGILSGGLTIGVGDTDLRFRENVTITDPAYLVSGQPLTVSTSRVGSGSQDDFLVGGYVGGSLSYAVSERVSVVAGAMFQAAGQAVNDTNHKEAVLKLGESILVSIGATYSF
ncbi:MAG: hypothetical protein C5B50_20400 [Verrucomicrobia bacterium]|nr:MAG: hypothetical protein C5B50_20400 [Verrucomicrobiota bacterium]